VPAEERRYAFSTKEVKIKKTKAKEETVTHDELEQLRQVCEYVKFHIGLYLATPSVIVLLADGLEVSKSSQWFGRSIGAMILIYIVSGISAGWFMGTYINQPLDDEMRRKFYNEAYSTSRRIFHHWLYWLGLAIGIGGLLAGSRGY
jgi:hypothetical protein